MNKKYYIIILLTTWISLIHAEEITINSFTLTAGETKEVNINLINESTDIGALQFSLHFPTGVTIAQTNNKFIVKKTDRLKYYDEIEETTKSLDCSCDDRGNGEYFFLISNGISGQTISGTSGDPILTITLQASDEISTTNNVINITGQTFAFDKTSGKITHADTYTTFYLNYNKVPIRIGEHGYCTYSWDKALDFNNCKNFENVFICIEDNDNSIIFKSIDDKIVPANTGVLIKGTPKEFIYPYETENVGEATSLLIGTADGPYTVQNDGDVYALAYLDGQLGFYPCKAGVIIPLYKCYLPKSDGYESFIMINIVIRDEEDYVSEDGGFVDGIKTVQDNKSNKTYYDLQGRQISTPTHGLYILNGKKIIVK